MNRRLSLAKFKRYTQHTIWNCITCLWFSFGDIFLFWKFHTCSGSSFVASCPQKQWVELFPLIWEETYNHMMSDFKKLIEILSLMPYIDIWSGWLWTRGTENIRSDRNTFCIILRQTWNKHASIFWTFWDLYMLSIIQMEIFTFKKHSL